MRILITNDDGIRASQLLPLARWAQKLGDVTVAAPKYEQSGKSHSLELHQPFEVKQFELAPGIPAYAVDSSPADCIRYAVLGLKQNYDLIISGINRGYNIGTDILYSGTVGAASEAAVLGLKAVALSTCPEYYDHAIEHLDQVFDFIFQHKLLEISNIYNVNIPPHGKEIRITRQGGPYYTDDFDPVGNDLHKAHGRCVYEDRGDDSLDTDAVMHGYISIMPLTIDRTNMDIFHKLNLLNP